MTETEIPLVFVSSYVILTSTKPGTGGRSGELNIILGCLNPGDVLNGVRGDSEGGEGRDTFTGIFRGGSEPADVC